MILERIETEMTRQDKRRQEKQREIKDEQKSKEIITYNNVDKYRRMINDSNNYDKIKGTMRNIIVMVTIEIIEA